MSNFFLGYCNKENITGSTKTLDEGDAGLVQYATVNCTVTMPAVVVGRCYILAAAPGVTLRLAPNASDKFMGNGFTSADNKYVEFATRGGEAAYILVSGSADGWNIVVHNGTLTKEA